MKKKFPVDVEIEELREIDDEGLGSVCGYFAKGLHDPQTFAIAINRRFELADYDQRVVAASEVETGYLRKIPLPRGRWRIERSKPGKGAFGAMYVFF